MASIKDVARDAGVSHATVSRVLSGTTPVRPTTAARVREAAQRLGYRPNRLARGLRRGQTGAVGILVSAIGRPLYVELIRRLEARLRTLDIVSFIIETARDPQVEREALAILEGMRAVGAVLVGDRHRNAPGNADLLAVHQRGMRIVTFSGQIFDSVIPCVRLDNHAAGMLAARHLVGFGHRQVAFLGAGLPEAVSSAQYLANRRLGYQEALRDAGAVLVPERVVSLTQHGPRETSAVVERLLALPDPPTALLASDDELAIQVLGAVLGLGRRVPEDLSVMGVDDIALAERVWPSLTTIRQPLDQMVERIVDHVLDRSPNGARRPVDAFAPELVVRRSTGPAPPVNS